MRRQKSLFFRLRATVLVFGAAILVLSAFWVENRTQFWYRLFWPKAQDIGLAVELDTPRYGQFTVTNLTNEIVCEIVLTICEDFSYAGEGRTWHMALIGNMKPYEKRVISYQYFSPKLKYDIGKLHLWIRCKEGKAYERISWSYASL